MKILNYRLVVLGPAVDRYPDLLSKRLRKGFENLGLDPDRELEVVYAGGADSFDEHVGNPVGVWFGGEVEPEKSHLDLLDRLREVGAPILPLVEELTRFPELVPEVLRPINGLQWDSDQVHGDVLRAFRLTRDLRQVFISYRRTDARRVAEGLFDTLSQRKFHVFLDTASVESMEPFQDVLWDRLADIDLVVLLDSPDALTSRWVNDELVQINNLGLGVLQLVWPEHTPFRGTELSTRHLLEPGDFEDGNHGPQGQLTEAALKRVAALAEDVRIASLGARRTRVVGELVTLVPPQLRGDVQAVGPLLFRPADATEADTTPLGIVLPVLGMPDAWSLHREQRFLSDSLRVRGVDAATVGRLIQADRVRVAYDGLGIRKDRAEHLIWLNGCLPMKTVAIDRKRAAAAGGPNELSRWLKSLTESGPSAGGTT